LARIGVFGGRHPITKGPSEMSNLALDSRAESFIHPQQVEELIGESFTLKEIAQAFEINEDAIVDVATRLETLRFLTDVLERIEEHNYKKTARLRGWRGETARAPQMFRVPDRGSVNPTPFEGTGRVAPFVG
jgi:hypothetical protein